MHIFSYKEIILYNTDVKIFCDYNMFRELEIRHPYIFSKQPKLVECTSMISENYQYVQAGMINSPSLHTNVLYLNPSIH